MDIAIGSKVTVLLMSDEKNVALTAKLFVKILCYCLVLLLCFEKLHEMLENLHV